MPLATAFVSKVGDANAPVQGVQQRVDPLGGSHENLRPLDYTAAGSKVYGHYRAVTFSGACSGIGAGNGATGTAGVLYSLRWTDTTRMLVLTRLAMSLEITAAVTTAVLFDAQSWVFRNSTANASGSGSSTLVLTTNNQKCYSTMGTSLFATGGEIRTLGTTTTLTLATGRTLDSAPFGYAYFGGLVSSNSGAAAVKLWPGTIFSPTGFVDLFNVSSAYTHPIILAANEGLEIQTITANNTDGSVKYSFLTEWAEVASF